LKHLEESLIFEAQSNPLTMEKVIKHYVMAFFRRKFYADNRNFWEEDFYSACLLGIYEAVKKFQTGGRNFSDYLICVVWKKCVQLVKMMTNVRHGKLYKFISIYKPIDVTDEEPIVLKTIPDPRIKDFCDVVSNNELIKKIIIIALQKLTDFELQIFVLSFLLCYKTKNICELLKISQKQIDNARKRIRKKLKNMNSTTARRKNKIKNLFSKEQLEQLFFFCQDFGINFQVFEMR